MPGAGPFGPAPARPRRSSRPRRKPSSRAAGADHRFRAVAGRGDAGEIPRRLAWLGGTGLRRIRVLTGRCADETMVRLNVPTHRVVAPGHAFPDRALRTF